MAVEIHVLSGSQQGRCLRFDGDRILVGDDAAADLRFDPDREAGARGKNAVLTLDDEAGWRISNEGGGVWLVNQTVVEKSQSHRLRSEDLVRVSESGPDFFFRLVSGPHGFAIPATAAPAKNANQPQHDQVQAQIMNRSPAAWDRGKRVDEPSSADVSPPADAIASTFERSPNIPPENTIARETPPLSEANEVWTAQVPQAADCASVAESTPVREADGRLPAEPAAPKRKRRVREASALGRLIGIVISALLGLACAYGLACWIGGEKNDPFHVFFKSPPSAGARP